MAALIPTLLTIRNSISSAWQQNVSIELEQKSNLIKTLLQVERLSLQKLVLLIAEEPTLKMSIQLADPITIQDTLSQLQSMLQADLIMITDAEVIQQPRYLRVLINQAKLTSLNLSNNKK